MFSVQLINAHPIFITLSNGRVFIVDSDNYPTTEDLMKLVAKLEKQYGSKPFVPGVTYTQG